jgi:pimeloyl-ACP methyl ester carboxylesterase
MIGHSFGGLVALEAARTYPFIASLALYEPGVSIDGSIDMTWTGPYRRKLRNGKPLEAFIAFVKCMNPQSQHTPDMLLKFILPRAMGGQKWHKACTLLEANLREHLEVARLDNTYPNYAEVPARTLLMYGAKSPARLTHPYRRLASVMPAATVREFAGLDHFGISEGAPQLVANAVTDFILKDDDDHSGTTQTTTGPSHRRRGSLAP